MAEYIDKQALIAGMAKVDGRKWSTKTLGEVLDAIGSIEIVRCKDCKHFSVTTLGMPYACWRGGDRLWGETGEHASHTLCIRVDSPDWFCAGGERREE